MKNLILILAVALSLSGCNSLGVKPEAYPFYCKIAGKTFVPERDNRVPGQLGSSPFRHTFSIEGKYLFISARNSPNEVSIVIRFPNERIEGGTYILSEDRLSTSYAVLTANNRTSNSDSYSKSGKVIITKTDGMNKFAGTFEFETYNEYLGKTVKITDGRFTNY